jgi:hypothetical protein
MTSVKDKFKQTFNTGHMFTRKITQTGINLILQVTLSNSSMLPIYDEEQVFKVLDEIEKHFSFIQDLYKRANSEENIPFRPFEKVDLTKFSQYNKLTAYKIHTESILRNKQLLLSYHNYRLNLICESCWRKDSWKLNSFLNLPERDFLNFFYEILSKYERDIGYDMIKIKEPVEEPIVQVLANSDIGERFYPAVGRVRFEKNSSHLLIREDIETLLSEGKLTMM